VQTSVPVPVLVTEAVPELPCAADEPVEVPVESVPEEMLPDETTVPVEFASDEPPAPPPPPDESTVTLPPHAAEQTTRTSEDPKRRAKDMAAF
jgi:hypothetical protein